MSIFRRLTTNPFEPLQKLLSKIDGCVMHVAPMLQANYDEQYDVVKERFRAITAAEHEADEIKNSIRDELRRSLFMPIDRWHFLDIISAADQIADRAEDLGYLLTIRKTRIPAELREHLNKLSEKVLECYAELTDTVGKFEPLVESGFAGPIAEEVLQGIFRVCDLEGESDRIMYKLSQHLFELEDKLSPVDLFMIHDIARKLGQFADSVEKLAKHIRRTIHK